MRHGGIATVRVLFRILLPEQHALLDSTDVEVSRVPAARDETAGLDWTRRYGRQRKPDLLPNREKRRASATQPGARNPEI